MHLISDERATVAGTAIEIKNLTKAFGAVRAVDDLTFTVRPGVVTGFLGPNGSGKTTTLRMLLGLVAPDSGSATIGGRKYVDIDRPASVVGAALEAASFHPGRSALDHLRVFAPLAGVADQRCKDVLEHVGLGPVSDRKVGGFSLGMRQRLGLATTLLGDPGVLVLDEPSNGLDPEGIVWLRGFLRHLAHDQGRTVLVSSHVLGEVQATVDDVVVIAGGRLVHESPLQDLVAMAADRVKVVTPDIDGFTRLAQSRGWQFEVVSGGLHLIGAGPAEVGAAAHAERLEIHGLAGEGKGLEEVFLELTDPNRSAVAA
ncbi:ABC-2 type transport system ATP-binding protein [Nocardioides daedukensis]|uniref:ABC-2 type transport system ATP-binding protein n=1 Tax=Nocardioides daedukensis TaxID=634462 RepID=A0A7Y9S2A7_9ACTN|nr:ATP-binding cassette domain-containing protein [Nocardioides daedukensis]NYG60595.1 ABC-2 type transport system ATP-binding protein [Nocardioides daedukensis]